MFITKKMKVQILLSLFISGLSFSVIAACDSRLPQTTPLNRFFDNNNGTVTDVRTQLMWKQCIEGQLTDGANGCTSGKTLPFNWQAALKQADIINNSANMQDNLGYGGWRLPNIKELESIVERQCENPAINQTLFPNTTAGAYWSSTPYRSGAGSVWRLIFTSGLISTNSATGFSNVRLVRDMNAGGS